MKYSDMARFPAHTGLHLGWLYAVEFSDKLVKVGGTRNPRDRMRRLYRQAENERGAVITSATVVALPAGNFYPHEKRALQFLRHEKPLPGCIEWFRGVPYMEAVSAVANAAQEAALPVPQPAPASDAEGAQA